MAGGGVRDAVHGQAPEALLPQEPGTQHFLLDDDDSVPELGGSRPDRIATVLTAGGGSAAHRGADRRRSPSGASSRRSCAADGGTAAGRHALLRLPSACSRAGYRSAQDLA